MRLACIAALRSRQSQQVRPLETAPVPLPSCVTFAVGLTGYCSRFTAYPSRHTVVVQLRLLQYAICELQSCPPLTVPRCTNHALLAYCFIAHVISA